MKKRSIASRAATLKAQHHMLLQNGSLSSSRATVAFR